MGERYIAPKRQQMPFFCQFPFRLCSSEDTSNCENILYRVVFFNWPSPISVPKRKLLSSQSWPFWKRGRDEHKAYQCWQSVHNAKDKITIAVKVHSIWTVHLNYSLLHGGIWRSGDPAREQGGVALHEEDTYTYILYTVAPQLQYY